MQQNTVVKYDTNPMHRNYMMDYTLRYSGSISFKEEKISKDRFKLIGTTEDGFRSFAYFTINTKANAIQAIRTDYSGYKV